MPNPYYNHTSGVPAVQTRGSSPNMRAEFDSVATGFNGVYTEILALAAAVGIAVTVSEVPVASSATTDIGNGYGPVVKITGTNPITSFGANYKGAIFLRFADALLLTNSVSLVLPGGANITTVAGDACIAVPIGNPASGWRILAYCRMSQTLIDDVAVRTSSTYANPAWLTSLAWSKLTGVPTTLAGFGITDAPTKTGTGASGSWGIDITGWAKSAGAGANIASAATLPLAARTGNIVIVTGTVATAATDLENGGMAICIAAGAWPLTYNATTNPVQGGVSYTCEVGDLVIYWKDNSGVLHNQIVKVNGKAIQETQIPVRQTVLIGPVDSAGLPAFGGSVGGATLTTSGAIVATSANGSSGDRRGAITNPAFTSPAGSGTGYLYLDINSDGTCTAGVSASLQPVYQEGGTYSTTNGQFTFNISEMTGKVGNGSVATQTHRVYIGECPHTAGVWSGTIVWYALRGRYVGTDPSTPSPTRISKNHNIGVLGVKFKTVIVNVTADMGYSTGEEYSSEGLVFSAYQKITVDSCDRLTVGIVANTTPLYGFTKTTGALTLLTTANWKTKFYVDRGW